MAWFPANIRQVEKRQQKWPIEHSPVAACCALFLVIYFWDCGSQLDILLMGVLVLYQYIRDLYGYDETAYINPQSQESSSTAYSSSAPFFVAIGMYLFHKAVVHITDAPVKKPGSLLDLRYGSKKQRQNPAWDRSSWFFLPWPVSAHSRHVSSAGRHATYAEAYLEAAFRDYLNHLAERSEKSIEVKYTAAGCRNHNAQTFSTKALLQERDEGDYDETAATRNVLELTVQSPEFYTRFVRYSHDIEAIFCEMTNSGTICVGRPELLPDLFLKPQQRKPLDTGNIKDYVLFKLIQKLRRIPDNGNAALCARPNTMQVDIRSLRMSSMDAYMAGKPNGSLLDNIPGTYSDRGRTSYRSTVLRLFVANRFFGDSLALVTLLELAVHLFAASAAVCLLQPWT